MEMIENGRTAQSPVLSSKLPDLFICKLYVVICHAYVCIYIQASAEWMKYVYYK